MNTESAVITSVCSNKDISTVLAENIDEVFTSHRDVWEGLKSYYLKFKSVPDISVLTEMTTYLESADYTVTLQDLVNTNGEILVSLLDIPPINDSQRDLIKHWRSLHDPTLLNTIGIFC